MTISTKTVWKDGMYFEGEVDGHVVKIDADQQFGGKDRGPRPKNLMLVSLGGCTAMDVVSILDKMRVKPDEFYVEVTAELTDQHPKVFKWINVRYYFKGKNLDRKKISTAVELSSNKYCGVSAMLRKVCDVNTEIIVEEVV